MAKKKTERPTPFPEPPQVPDHIWVVLDLSVAGLAGRTKAKAIQDFCEIFGVNPITVEARLREEAGDGLVCQPDNRTLH
jgi:hypothetical protein